MIPIIEVKLSPDDRRALARAATKAALAAGMSLEEWRRQRSGAECQLSADVAMAYQVAPPAR
uniref:Uncharacterized protein n=1 Tax=Bosea sp. NBC_00436 TaxID=2969620 RepID=A0A9E8CKF5_9HYPH